MHRTLQGQHGSVWPNWIRFENDPSSMLAIWSHYRYKKDCTDQLFEIILRDASQFILLKIKRSVNLGDPCRAPGWIKISSLLVILLSLNSRNSNDKDIPENECLLIDSISLNAKPNHNKYGGQRTNLGISRWSYWRLDTANAIASVLRTDSVTAV